MLRFLATVFDWIATVCAILSPIAIVHWLLKATQLPQLKGVVESLDPLFAPLN